MRAMWGNRYLAIGVALWFALVFGAFPATDPSSVMGDSFVGTKPALLVVVYSGVVAAVALPILATRFRIERSPLRLMVCACFLQYLGAALAVGVAANPVVASYIGGFIYGSGNACAIFAWGVLLVRCADDVREAVFLAALPVAGLVLLVTGLLFAGHSLASILLLPIVSLACFWKSEADGSFEDQRGDAGAEKPTGGEGLRPLVIELLKLMIVFGVIGFIWQLYALDTSVGPGAKGVLFSLGFVLAAVVLQLFVQYSAGVGVGSFVRWVFPIAAVGLFFVSLKTTALVSVACVLFASAHASLEAMMRIRTIGLARRYRTLAGPAVTLGWGFAAINLGATSGEALFQAMAPVISAHVDTAIVAVIMLLVVVGAIIPEVVVVAKPVEPCTSDGGRRLSDSERRAVAMGERYGLSAREREVLGLLLEGRSGPVIRESLGLSKSTVDTHVRHIYQKTGVDSRQGLINLSLGVGSA